jgi:hypothetical protein
MALGIVWHNVLHWLIYAQQQAGIAAQGDMDASRFDMSVWNLHCALRVGAMSQ